MQSLFREIMRQELKSEWKLELHPNWIRKGWEGEALKQSKTILLFFNKDMDCFHGFLHELTHAIEIEKRPDKKPGLSHDVFFADTLTRLISTYTISIARAHQEADSREHIYNVNLECAREGARRATFDAVDKLKLNYQGSHKLIDEEDYQRLKEEQLHTKFKVSDNVVMICNKPHGEVGTVKMISIVPKYTVFYEKSKETHVYSEYELQKIYVCSKCGAKGYDCFSEHEGKLYCKVCTLTALPH